MRSGSSLISPRPTSETPRSWSYVPPVSTSHGSLGSRGRFLTFCDLVLVSNATAPSRNPYHMATEWMLPSGEIVDIVIDIRSCRSASTSSDVILISPRWLTPCPMALVMACSLCCSPHDRHCAPRDRRPDRHDHQRQPGQATPVRRHPG